MIFGYARVNTAQSNLDIQKDELTNYGVDEIVEEIASGIKINREGLNELLNRLKENDTLVVYKLDRLGRTMHQLVDLINLFESTGVNFVSIKDRIDTSTATGSILFNIAGATIKSK